jgi:GTP-binding protein HflX
LDPTLRRLKLHDTEMLVLADTVGFIRELPHDLVESFSSTLEETRDAALLLHVVDCAASDRDDLIHHVNEVLAQIEADEVPQLIVYNKIDKLEDMAPRLERNADGQIERIWLSAQTGEGLDLLRQALQEYFPHDEQSEYLN